MQRKDFLGHVGWTGTGLIFTLSAGGLMTVGASAQDASGFSFVQISDSHIGFKLPANDHVAQTLEMAVDAINALPNQPAFVVHTGDITHLAKPAQFDAAKQILGKLRAPLLTIPGEHDTIGEGAVATYMQHFGRSDAEDGWYSWDQNGVHFLALVNVFDFEKMGLLGQRQLDFVAKDLAAQKRSTPVVVFGHVPLYALYPKWGWTTEDGAKVLAMLAPFDNVTVLNGHIHQVIHHQEGNIRFATANATAYPQPAPGTASGPGPLTVPKDQLLHVIGYRTVEIGGASPQITDRTLG
ncbi:MAG: metallophosphoesterase family protein [Vulcanimicrobiaceae bacterium]